MSASDKWNDKVRGRCGGVIFPRLINISSGGEGWAEQGEVDGWRWVKETTSSHYFYDISSLSLLPMVHCTPGSTDSSCIKRLSGRWAWRPISLIIAEFNIISLAWEICNVTGLNAIITLALSQSVLALTLGLSVRKKDSGRCWMTKSVQKVKLKPFLPTSPFPHLS